MSNLLHRLATTPPRETSGSRTANRFSYQKNWALCFLLELHEKKENYVLILDYHDDVLVLDSDTNPTGIEFYQIKTKKDGTMGLGHLLARKQNAALSIMGKLVSNLLAFPNDTKSLNLVSTVPFGFTLETTNKPPEKGKTILSEVCAEELSKVLETLKTEHRIPTLPDIASMTFFIVADLSLKDTETHARGKLSDFLDNMFPDKAYPVRTVYRTLISEIQRRNDKEDVSAMTEQLLASKAISKKQLTQMLAAIPDNRNIDKAIADGIAQLRNENVPYQLHESIRGAARQYEIERMDRSNRPLQRVRDEVIDILRHNKAAGEQYDSLSAKIDGVISKLKVTPATLDLIGGKDYLKAIVLVEGWYV